MEYAIGRILFLGQDTSNIARIQVMYYSINGFWSSSEIPMHFPPVGNVFAPNLKADYPTLKTNDIIIFTFEENPVSQVGEDKDTFIIPIKKDGGEARKLLPIFNVSEDDIFNRTSPVSCSGTCFFFRKKGAIPYICGPIHSLDLSPLSGKEVKGWTYKPQHDTIKDECGNDYLVTPIKEFTTKDPAIEVDCMTDSQLSDWLKSKIQNSLSGDVLRQIKDKIKNITANSESDYLDEIRFARARKQIDKLEFEWSELQNIRSVPGFKVVIDSAVEAAIDQVIASEKVSLDVKRLQIEAKMRQLDNDLQVKEKENGDKIKESEKILKDFQNQIDKISEDISKSEEQYQSMLKKKEDLIDLIRIEAGIASKPSARDIDWGDYPLEKVLKNPRAQKVTDQNKRNFYEKIKDDFDFEIGFICSALNGNMHNFKTADIRTGILLAEVLGNSIYQLCQPSPKWISFKEFWKGSLSSIWDSAHKNKDVWHFLLIENFNIALPECWGAPLWNVLNCKTKQIPYATEPLWPSNLIIIVSTAQYESDDGSHLGLPTHVADNWFTLDYDKSWDNTECRKMLNGLAVNEQYYYPVE